MRGLGAGFGSGLGGSPGVGSAVIDLPGRISGRGPFSGRPALVRRPMQLSAASITMIFFTHPPLYVRPGRERADAVFVAISQR